MISHHETHFKSSDTVRYIVIGMADGLTVPFALAAGLTGVSASSALVVTAGLAEIAAGAIAMGLGGYLAAKSDQEHYLAELKREALETKEQPEQEAKEVSDIFKKYGLTDEQIAPVLRIFREKPSRWVDFMMRFELGLERPDASRGQKSALTISLSYVVGGLIPLSPYMAISQTGRAVWTSAFFTLAALFIFGWVKGHFTGTRPLRAALQTTLIGGLAASAAFFIAKLIS